jgi:hypothetical protein
MISPAGLFRLARYQMRNDHAKIVDVQHAIHIGVFQVERPLRFVDSIRQFQELGKHKLGDFVNTVWTVPFEDILVAFARITLFASTDTIIGGIEEIGYPGIDACP